MQPTLLDVSLFGRALAIDAHGLCLTLGAIAGLLLSLLLARRLKDTLPTGEVRDLGLELILVGLVGARLVYLLHHGRAYAEACRGALTAGDGALACARPLWVWDGLSFHGGLALALAWLLWRGPKRSLPVLRLADLAAPGLALAYAASSVGCFLSGCCFGRLSSSVLAVRFPPESVAWQALFDRGWLSPAAPLTPPLAPVQLYLAGAHLLLAAVLLVLAWRGRAGRGWLFGAFLIGHVLIRLALLPLSDAG
jgi:phosphatidylglycerol:prolipoprotein diacylglycerol transferase